MKCYDCKKKMTYRGVTVGRISCPTIWASICYECFEKEPMSQKEKKKALQEDAMWKDIASRITIRSGE